MKRHLHGRKNLIDSLSILKNHRSSFIGAFFLLFCSIFSYAGNGQSKFAKVTLVKNNVALLNVLNEIEQQTNYLFIYSNDVNVNKKVSINVTHKTLPVALNKLFKKEKIGYELEGRHIVLKNNTSTPTTSSPASQAEIRIKGEVTDSSGEPIIGASVKVKGKASGTITDINGEFVLSVPNDGELIISYIGYKTETIAITQKRQYTIILKEDTKTLDEVVVVGYGSQKKVNLSGSVASIDSKKLEDRPIQNISSGLQGLVPGVTITGTNGAPGMDGGTIRVRGTGTLNSASPYILIDGIEAGNLNSIDPNDIESISILKDAASAAIYGSKASNGVILVTTKRGKEGKTQVSYNGYVSFQNTTKTIDRMSSYDYASLYNKTLLSEGKAARFSDEEIEKFRAGTDPNYPNTDWYNLAYKTGLQHRHNINVKGGTENVKYMTSVGYLHQTGILPNAGREQFNARTNLDMKISERFTARMNLAFIKNKYTDPSSAYYGGGSDQIIRQLNLISPWIVARYDDGTYGTISDGNPIAWLDSDMKVKRDNYNFTGSVALDYAITSDLKATVTGSFVNNTQNYSFFQKFIQYNPNKKSDPNSLDERFYLSNRTNFDALLNYKKSFGSHNFKGLAGWHTEKYNYKYSKAYRKNFPNNDLTDMNAGDASTQQNEGFTRELAMISWFARINYDYAGKYLLEANVRADASSRFTEGHRWGYFPSFSGAWRISEEAFMENTKGWLNNLKLRASWGQLGNQDALNDFYPALNTYNLGAKYVFDGALSSGYYQKKYRLSTISWEKASTWGFGVDFGFLHNKLSGSIDYYNRKTTGIIMDVDVPYEFALDAYKDNVGSMRNSGVEVNLAYNDKFGEVTFGAAANFAYNKNEILDLGGVEYIKVNDDQRNIIGNPINSYYIYQADGFFNTQEEADAYTAKYGNPFGGGKFKAGDIRYVDTNKDGKLTADDRIVGNNAEPAYTFGLNLNAEWKGIDLALIFNGAAKVSRLYDSYEVYGGFSGDTSHPATIWKDAWSETNHNASMPRLYTNTNSPSCSRNAQSTFWLQDTHYIRLKNLQLGYTLPKSFLHKLGVSNLRIYYSVENLFTIDDMKLNIDPEATSSRLSSYPLLRTHAFGLNVSF